MQNPKINSGHLFKLIVWIFIIILIIFILLTGLSLARPETGSLCMNHECIENFIQNIDLPLKVTKALLDVTVALVTILGILVALISYESNQKTSRITNHIEHKNLFSNYISNELSRFTEVHNLSVDVLFWYTRIFPKSKDGELSPSKEYIASIKNINSIIERSNNLYSAGKKEHFNDKKHQHEIIEALAKIGIHSSILSRIDHYEVERCVFQLINSVNSVFQDPNNACEKLIEPTYR